MTLNNDLSKILSYLKNSFITSDETGMCEHILEDNSLFISNKISNVESSGDELRHSPDIVPHMDLGGYRFRSNTTVRLDNLRIEKQKLSQVDHIFWSNSNLMKDNFFEHFPLYNTITNTYGSLLSQQIQEFEFSDNPYKIYLEFDGKKCGIGVKEFNIYLTMLSGEERAYPMSIFVNVRATILQLIGLVCCLYTEKNMGPLLRKVEDYSLCLVEDDGEVDPDFPPLDPNELVSKFEFPNLALVETETSSSHSSASINKINLTTYFDTSKKLEYAFNETQEPSNSSTFIVQQLHTFRPRTTVKLTINQSQVIISSKQFSHFLPCSDITKCYIHHHKSINQVILRLIYNYNNKSVQKDFDCDAAAACEIKTLINDNIDSP